MGQFYQKLYERWVQGRFVCVGLDTEHKKIPVAHLLRSSTSWESMIEFNDEIVQATANNAAAYKLNLAFYVEQGQLGIIALRKSIEAIREICPEAVIILDSKTADIGNTNGLYGKAFLDLFGADALTVHLWHGREAMKPFLDRADKGVIVVVRTSNDGADEFQNLPVLVEGAHIPLWQYAAGQMPKWNYNQNVAVVAGATQADDIKVIRLEIGEMPILIPGIGAQGGDLETAVVNACNSENTGFIVNSSRGIIFASQENDFAKRAGEEAEKLNTAILGILAKK